jgi:CRP-like cAMP-binding protein
MLGPQALRESYLFQGLDDAQISSVMSQANVKSFDGGVVIARQFEKGNDIFVVASGTVVIKGFNDEVLAELGEGSIIGEVALVDESPRSANVVAKGSVQMLVINGAQLKGIMSADDGMRAAIYERLSRVLAGRLRAANM